MKKCGVLGVRPEGACSTDSDVIYILLKIKRTSYWVWSALLSVMYCTGCKLVC